MASLDPLVFGHRLRYERKRRNLTLKQLGELVAKPAPLLSQIENGHSEPRLSLISALADALGCTEADLLSASPPDRRAELEIAVVRAQESDRYQALKLPLLKPSAKMPDEALEHVVALWQQLHRDPVAHPRTRSSDVVDPTRSANIELREMMSERNNYFASIEQEASRVLAAVDYGGYGPVSERMLINIGEHFGFTIDRVMDLPRTTRSVTDTKNRVIYIPQRNELSTRAARSVVLQTLGHFVLEHEDPTDLGTYLRQRVEANYFAGALLAPEGAAVAFLQEADSTSDISAEDLKEIFYISYEMAAHRLTNLLTEHFGIPVHFIRTDADGVIWKAYENNGVPFPMAADGEIEGQRVAPTWGPRSAFTSPDTFSLHYQFTDTEAGEFWCVTHVEADGDPLSAVTLGTTGEHAHRFRGGNTTQRFESNGSESGRAPEDDELTARWHGVAWPSARDRSLVLAGLPPGEGWTTAFPGVDMTEVYRFLEGRSPRAE